MASNENPTERVPDDVQDIEPPIRTAIQVVPGESPVHLVKKPDDRSGLYRTFIASRRIEQGEIILTDVPICYPSSLSTVHIFCAHCYLNEGSDLFRCNVCNIAKFCSSECKERSHLLLVCQALPTLCSAPQVFASELLYLLSMYNTKAHVPLFLLSLPSSTDDVAFSEEETLQLHSQLGELIRVIPPYFSIEITSRLLSKRNAYSSPLEITSDHRHYEAFAEVNGVHSYAVYLYASLISHDCLPNIIPSINFDPSFHLIIKRFRALHAIEQGSEVSISFVPVNMGYNDRQRMLLEHFGIGCRCMRCYVESKTLILQRHGCNCGGLFASFPPSENMGNLMECNTCGLTRQVIQAEQFGAGQVIGNEGSAEVGGDGVTEGVIGDEVTEGVIGDGVTEGVIGDEVVEGVIGDEVAAGVIADVAEDVRDDEQGVVEE